MSDWTPVREFPLHQDLTELARFIQRCGLPLRISEENNCQLLSTLDPRLRELLLPVLERWDAGEINLAELRVETVPESALHESETRTAPEQSAESPASGPGAGNNRDLPPQTEEPADPGRGVAAAPLPNWPLQKTPLSLLLIALCFIGWLLLRENMVRGLIIFPDRGGDFALAGSTLAWHLQQGEYWRLWSPAMVHFSLPHALFNALGVWILGRSLEARAGTLMFAVLVGISALVSNLAQYYWSPGTVFGGMSGVVYALVGSVLVLQRWCPAWRDVPSGIVLLAVGWLLLCATGIVTFVLGVGVANAAHVGGFVSGLLLTLSYCLLGGARKFAGPPAGSISRNGDSARL